MKGCAMFFISHFLDWFISLGGLPYSEGKGKADLVKRGCGWRDWGERREGYCGQDAIYETRKNFKSFC